MTQVEATGDRKQLVFLNQAHMFFYFNLLYLSSPHVALLHVCVFSWAVSTAVFPLLLWDSDLHSLFVSVHMDRYILSQSFTYIRLDCIV